MHPDILTKSQNELLPLIGQFSISYHLVGGTAIALQIGHRRSNDFDLFTRQDIQRMRIYNTIRNAGFEIETLYEAFDQMHCLVNSVKLTFFSYPFEVPAPILFKGVVHMPTLPDLAAMKALALGGRSKWKDYVDLYFLLKSHLTLQEIEHRAHTLFQDVFNAKLFREQLAFFKDVDFSEAVEMVSDDVPTDEEIQSFLTKIALTAF
jgi:DNA-binding transcriptional MerR regulator